jgi:hypothetical protein
LRRNGVLTTVTLDTSVAVTRLTAAVIAGQFDLAAVSVTDRETAGTRDQAKFQSVGRVPETGVGGNPSGVGRCGPPRKTRLAWSERFRSSAPEDFHVPISEAALLVGSDTNSATP